MKKNPRLYLTLAGIFASVISGSAFVLLLPFIGFGPSAGPVIVGWLPSMVVVGAVLGYAASFLSQPRFFVLTLPPLGWILGTFVAGAAISTGVVPAGQELLWGTVSGVLAGLGLWLIAFLLGRRMHREDVSSTER